MRPFEACPFCNGEFMFDWINDTRRCDNCGALFTWRIIREPSGVPIDLTLQLKKAEDRIAELKAENDELKERVAMLDVNSVYKSLSEMGYIGQVANLEAENAALQARIAELEKDNDEFRQLIHDWIIILTPDDGYVPDSECNDVATPIDVALRKRIAELEGRIDQLTAHSDIERQDDKSSNDTQKETFVYGKDSKPLPCPFCGNIVDGKESR